MSSPVCAVDTAHIVFCKCLALAALQGYVLHGLICSGVNLSPLTYRGAGLLSTALCAQSLVTTFHHGVYDADTSRLWLFADFPAKAAEPGELWHEHACMDTSDPEACHRTVLVCSKGMARCFDTDVVGVAMRIQHSSIMVSLPRFHDNNLLHLSVAFSATRSSHAPMGLEGRRVEGGEGGGRGCYRGHQTVCNLFEQCRWHLCMLNQAVMTVHLAILS